jgi:hypothetical protein
MIHWVYLQMNADNLYITKLLQRQATEEFLNFFLQCLNLTGEKDLRTVKIWSGKIAGLARTREVDSHDRVLPLP